jgi:hypothetical protein
MMNRLSSREELIVWNERFWSFNDGVLRSMAVTFASSTTCFEAVIETSDQASPSGWSLVTIRMTDVSSLAFTDGTKGCYQVLSDGLHTMFEDERIAIEFGGREPRSLAEALQSPCHVVAKVLEWDAHEIEHIGGITN